MNPITRRKESSKAYDRKRVRQAERQASSLEY